MEFDYLLSLLKEEFTIDSLDADKAYEIFSNEYLQSTGKTWDKEKFMRRSQNWTFWGDEYGFIATRPQKSGFVKLVGAAGNDKSKYKGIKELLNKNLPVWGMVDEKIARILLKLGFMAPNFIEKQILLKKLQNTNVLGDSEIKGQTKDGGFILSYPDIGETVKYFLGSPKYWEKIYSLGNIKDLMKY